MCLERSDIEIIDTPSKVLGFLTKTPFGWEYNYSFIENMKERIEYDEHPLSEEETKSFQEIYFKINSFTF